RRKRLRRPLLAPQRTAAVFPYTTLFRSGGATLGWTVDVLKGLQSGSPEFGSGESRAELRTLGGSGVAYDLTSFRYLIRCGWSASAPRRRLRSSSYSR